MSKEDDEIDYLSIAIQELGGVEPWMKKRDDLFGEELKAKLNNSLRKFIGMANAIRQSVGIELPNTSDSEARLYAEKFAYSLEDQALIFFIQPTINRNCPFNSRGNVGRFQYCITYRFKSSVNNI